MAYLASRKYFSGPVYLMAARIELGSMVGTGREMRSACEPPGAGGRAWTMVVRVRERSRRQWSSEASVVR